MTYRSASIYRLINPLGERARAALLALNYVLFCELKKWAARGTLEFGYMLFFCVSCHKRIISHLHPEPLCGGRVDIDEWVFGGVVGARRSQVAAVEDDAMREAFPILSWQELHKIALDLDGILVVREVKASHKPYDMGIHGDAFDHAIRSRENNGRSLARHAGEQ